VGSLATANVELTNAWYEMSTCSNDRIIDTVDGRPRVLVDYTLGESSGQPFHAVVAHGGDGACCAPECGMARLALAACAVQRVAKINVVSNDVVQKFGVDSRARCTRSNELSRPY
jgi:hypothetical protein